MSDHSEPLLTPAWAVLFAVGLLAAYVGVAAFLSGAPGERPAGAILCILVTLGAIAVWRARRRAAAMATTVAAVGIGQVVVAATMISRHWGAISVIVAVNAIFLAGWVVAAGLFFAASRRPPAG